MYVSTSLYKKNGGLNYDRKAWTEYPSVGAKWRKNWDAIFGVKCVKCKAKLDDVGLCPNCEPKPGPCSLPEDGQPPLCLP